MALRFTKKSKAVLILSLVVFIALAVTVAVFVNESNKKTNTQSGTQPNFQTVLPANTSIEDFGGWQKHTSPGGDIFFTYLDEIGSIPISVSQQPLPEGFSSDLDAKVAEVAKGYNTSIVLDANGTKVHIGNSAKGPQSVIFSKNNLLISIVSQKEIQNASWISYINSLKS